MFDPSMVVLVKKKKAVYELVVLGLCFNCSLPPFTDIGGSFEFLLSIMTKIFIPFPSVLCIIWLTNPSHSHELPFCKLALALI